MDKLLILNNIQSHYGFEKDAKFAEFLGIPPQNLSKWKNRCTFDAELIYTKCTEINAHWILTGEGEMLKKDDSTIVNINKKPSPEEGNGLMERYVMLLEQTVASLQDKIKDLNDK